MDSVTLPRKVVERAIDALDEAANVMTSDMMPRARDALRSAVSDYAGADMHKCARRYALQVLERIERDAVTYRDVEQQVLAEIDRLRGAA